MTGQNIVFIAKSLDGYIADKNGGIDWLHSIPNPENIDTGFIPLMERIDAIVMGRTTYEVVCSFDIKWPYSKPVFVLSTTLRTVPDHLKEKVFIVNDTIPKIVQQLNDNGYLKLYIDGGTTINSFLKEDLIDEMIISTLPIVLGGANASAITEYILKNSKADFVIISEGERSFVELYKALKSKNLSQELKKNRWISLQKQE